MKKMVLIAGAHGFVGVHAAQAFKAAEYEVLGIGHGAWTPDEAKSCGIDRWVKGTISLELLNNLEARPSVIINCSGSSSVGAAMKDPEGEFNKTVIATEALLEFMRLKAPDACFVQLSSPAVIGMHEDAPIRIMEAHQPVSAYGHGKNAAEGVVRGYQQKYKLDTSIIRFFSLYGPGLRKQLLWDACQKLKDAPLTAEFGGSGQETRDWLYIDDAVELIFKVIANKSRELRVFNGGFGRRVTVKQALEELVKAFGNKTEIKFNGQVRPGDPRFYLADISGSLKLGWKPAVALEQGTRRYVDWFKKEVM